MRKVYITAFFLLHALALGIGSVPSDAADSITRAILAEFGPIAHFYLNATGQWQKWNLFAPDPLREFASTTVEILSPSREATSIAITGDTLLWYERTSYLKILRQLLREGDEYRDLRLAFLSSLCTKWHLAAGSTLRFHTTLQDALDPTLSREIADDDSITCNQS